MLRNQTAGIIVAIAKDNVIGSNGSLPWHYSEDLKRFKARTLDSTIIMGRLTWESLPSKPLPGRRNIVITSDLSLDVENYPSIKEALEATNGNQVWFIGGARIFEEAVNYCNVIDVTYVPDEVDDDEAVRFPKIDWNEWKYGLKVPFMQNSNIAHQLFTRISSQ